MIAASGSELFDGEPGCLAIVHGSGRFLEAVARWGQERRVESVFPPDHCWAIRRGQPHEVGDPRSGLLSHHFVEPPTSGYLCWPLLVRGENLGLLYLGAASANAVRERKLKPANCAGCHESAVKEYQSTAHAKARAGGNMVAGTCSDCHGNHDIKKSGDPASRTHIAKIESTCGSCHGNDPVVKQANLPGGNIGSLGGSWEPGSWVEVGSSATPHQAVASSSRPRNTGLELRSATPTPAR